MKIKIDKSSGVPLYLQIREQVKNLVDEGILLPGERLIPERELADRLEVSRNTVSMAFKELEQEGMLLVEQGRGTFIADRQIQVQKKETTGRKEKALQLIDQALDECLELGFSVKQFVAFATVRAQEKEESLMKVRMLFIDCNQEQLHNFTRQFRENIRLNIVPILLKDFLAGGSRMENLLKQIDLVVTTTTHSTEVGEQLKKLGSKQEVVPVAAQPKTESLLRLNRFAGKAKIGLIALSPEFAQVVKRALDKLGIYEIIMDFTTVTNAEDLEKFIQDHDLLLVYIKRYREIKAMAGEKEVIPYWHELDVGSTTLIQRAAERITAEKGRRGNK